MKIYILDKDIRLKYDEASDIYYAFCISSGDHYVVTKNGYDILEFLENGKSIDEIINYVHKKEMIDYDICKTDCINFVNKSKKIGIISINNGGQE